MTQDTRTTGTSEPTPTAASYFNDVVPEYLSSYSAPSPGGHALRARLQRVLELLETPDGKVLDVGCGPGVLAQELLASNIEVWGLDAAPNMIEECRKRFGNHARAHFALGDATRLAFPDSFFDAVICTGVIDHIPAYQSAIREMTRVVRKDGSLLVSFPNLSSPYASWKRFVFYPTVSLVRPFYHRLTRRRDIPGHLSYRRNLFTVRGATALMASHGAVVTGLAYYFFNVVLSPLDDIFPRWALGVTERLEELRFGPLRWLGAGFILKARKL